jgi:hypothetical protein
VGFLLQRLLNLDPQPLSAIIFYALTPVLIFQLILESQFKGPELLRMSGLAALVVLTLSLLSFGISRLLRLSPVSTAALILTVGFMNSGNYGLSLNNFALGQIGLAWASLYFITTALLNNSLGVFIASTGKLEVRKALKGMLRVPTIYAIVIALLLRLVEIPLPSTIIKPVDTLSAATIPAMLLVLGMQISRAKVPSNKGLVAIATFLRLIISPLLAWVLTLILQLPTVGAQAGILEASMPSPVLAIIISMEYDTDSDFVSAVVLITTLLSPFTVTPIMSLIGI